MAKNLMVFLKEKPLNVTANLIIVVAPANQVRNLKIVILRKRSKKRRRIREDSRISQLFARINYVSTRSLEKVSSLRHLYSFN